MKILGMGMPELLIILGVILLIFGPKNLPKLGAALGSTVKNLRDGLGGDKPGAKTAEDAEQAVLTEADDDEEDEPAARPAPKKVKVRAAKAAETA